MIQAVLALVVLAVLVAVPATVAGLKGRRGSAILGSLLWPPVSWPAALGLAEPGSWWARRFYDEARTAQARERSERRKGLDERFREGGSGHGMDPARFGSAPRGSIQCRLCGRVFLSEDGALTHADGYHTEVAFEDAKAALVPFEVAAATMRPGPAGEE